ncbi:MAG: Uma2 family endonuclease [Lachnospiraceae bacterium]|nr:Uma2 family endonuclease [Lachnospiraceae bacterium]
MSLAQEKIYTIDDIYALPEGHRAELIEGQIYNMAPPNLIHQRISYQLSRIIGNYISDNKGHCEVLPAPFAVFLNADENTYVEPDISVICDKHKLNEHGCIGAPDFIIEVVSPSSRKMDYSTKNTLYTNAGVREYWIVDSFKERTTVYRYEEDAAPMIYPFNQDIPSAIFENLRIRISNLL